MKIILKVHFTVLAYLVLFIPPSVSQVLQGDANADGIVNNLDILYIGYSFGNLGPARINVDSTDEGPSVLSESVLLWDTNFPDEQSTNYINADADGNGFIDEGDFLKVSTNYNFQTEAVNPIEYITGTFNVDPQLGFEPPAGNFRLSEGDRFDIPIFFGNEDLPVQLLNGLAFSIEFDSTAIQEVRIDFSDSWANKDGGLFSFQIPPLQASNQFDAAVTRYGIDPVNGFGQFAKLSVVIEGDLIGFFENVRDSAATILKIDKLFALDEGFNKIPITGDSIQFMLYHPQIVSNQWVKNDLPVTVFPSPANEYLIIESPLEIQSLECFNTLGISVEADYQVKGKIQVEMNCNHLPSGTYLVKLHTNQGIVSRKFIIQHE